MSGCGSSAQAGGTAGVLKVVAAENFWGSIAKQEGGSQVNVQSVIVNPNADPHSYEPSVSDARSVANAGFFIYNGAGYDSWATSLVNANPVKSRRLLVVGDLVKPVEDNPHLWYDPRDVLKIAAAITAGYQSLQPKHSSYFARLHARFVGHALRRYLDLVHAIRAAYSGVPVGATESIFVYMAAALHLDLITPPRFMKAIAEGTEPTVGDKETFDSQILVRKIRVLVFNKQNVTPDVQALVSEARGRGIPIVPITETLAPAGASFETWQTNQLRALRAALAR